MKYDFGNAHLTFKLEDFLEPMKLLRRQWNAAKLSEVLGVPLGSRVSWKREDDPEAILDLLFMGFHVYKVVCPDGQIVYALPDWFRKKALDDFLMNAPVGGNA